jgi:HK97 gp10 family phage protein
VAKVTMKLEGMEALQRAIRTAPEAVKVGSQDAVAKTSFAVAQRARSLVPVATGTLKSLIASSIHGLAGRVGFSDDQRAFYWRFVEYGTVKMSARPFMRPAAEAEERDFIERMRAVGTRLERDFMSGRFT